MQNTNDYRSKNMTPSTKARYVNRWTAFHKAFPNVSLKEWCDKQNISSGTFYAWLADPRYNRELREALRTAKNCVKKDAPSVTGIPSEPDTDISAAEKGEQLSLIDYLDIPLDDETKEERDLFQEAKERLKESPKAENKETSSAKKDVPGLSINNKPDSEAGTISPNIPFMTYTCADFRIEIYKTIPVSDVNMVVGYAESLMHRKATRAARDTMFA